VRKLDSKRKSAWEEDIVDNGGLASYMSMSIYTYISLALIREARASKMCNKVTSIITVGVNAEED
jgi:hypothetical protein